MPVGAGIATAGAGLVSSFGAASASSKATKAAIAQQEKTRALVAPFVNNGTDALNTLSDPNRMMAAFNTDPGYQFRMDQGIAAINQNKAVAGLLRSGSTIKDSMNYGQGMASAEYEKVYNRLFDRAQLGMQGVGVTAGVNTANANAITNNGTNQGNAMLAGANAIAGGIGTYGRLTQGGYGNPSSTTSYPNAPGG